MQSGRKKTIEEWVYFYGNEISSFIGNMNLNSFETNSLNIFKIYI